MKTRYQLLIIILFSLIATNASSQQSAIKTYKYYDRMWTILRTYKVLNGEVCYTSCNYIGTDKCASENLIVCSDEEIIKCNPNIQGERVIDAMEAMNYVYSGFVFLGRILYEDEYTTDEPGLIYGHIDPNDISLEKAIYSFEEAARLYNNAKCDTGLDNMTYLLTKFKEIKEMANSAEQIRLLNQMAGWREDYEDVSCGFVEKTY